MKTKMQSKKFYIFDAVIILIVSGLMIFYLLKNGIISEIKNIGQVSAIGLIVLSLMMIAFILIDSFIIYRSNKLAGTGLGIGGSVETYFFGNLGSGITPSKVGHFPFIFYYLGRRKTETNKSLELVCMNQIIYSVSIVFVYFAIFIVCMVQNYSIVISGTTIYLKFVSLIGLGFNLAVIAVVLLMSYSKKFHGLIINICACVLLKFKKITSKEDYKKEQTEKMQMYKSQITFFIKHLYKFIPSMLIYVLFLMIWGAFPYVIYLFLTNGSFLITDYFMFFTLNQAMTYITNVIPIPGGIGVAEYSFLTVFASVYPESLLSLGMIVWRIFTYYIPLIISFIVFIVFMIRNRNRDKSKQNKNTSNEINSTKNQKKKTNIETNSFQKCLAGTTCHSKPRAKNLHLDPRPEQVTPLLRGVEVQVVDLYQRG